MSQKRYACIDIGTNSIRLLIADVEDGRLVSRTKKLKTTKLGLGVSETRMLDAHRMIDSLDAIDSFYHEAIVSGAERVFLYATAAVRDAYNGIDFRQMVNNKIEVAFDIISGTKEATLGFYGTQMGCDTSGDNLVIDIGGGSTEFIYGENGKMKDAISMDLGGVRLTGSFIKADPPVHAELDAIMAYIDKQLGTVHILFKNYPIKAMIGIGGTVTAFASMAQELEEYDPDKVHGSVISLERVKSLNTMLQGKTLAERQKVIGLEPSRADIIISSGLILERSMETFGVDSIKISDYDNLEGYLLKKLKSLDKKVE